jgi:hypothetical protein
MFDDLPALATPKVSELHNELDRFLGTDPEHVQDVLMWWFERWHTYPRLSRMARDYLSIPGRRNTKIIYFVPLTYLFYDYSSHVRQR